MLQCLPRCDTYDYQGCHLTSTLPLNYQLARVCSRGVDDAQRLHVAQVLHDEVPVQVRHIGVRCGCAHARAQFRRIEPARARPTHERTTVFFLARQRLDSYTMGRIEQTARAVLQTRVHPPPAAAADAGYL